MKQRLLDILHDLARVERYPLLKRFHGRARARTLWVFDRDSVARGVAIGFFFGILTPVAQILFALVAAILLRANLVVAVASTSITNPLILPFVYLYAYRVGTALTGRDRSVADVAESEEAAEHALDVTSWYSTLLDWFSSVGVPLLVGVVCIALTLALVGFLGVHGIWQLVLALRARRR